MKILSIIFIILMLASPVYADGLRSLISVGSGMDNAGKALAKETKIFNRVKLAIESGSIQKGQKKSFVSRSFGDPVVKITEDAKEKWMYKPAYSSHFSNNKIYLIFGNDETIENIKVLSDAKE